RRLPQRASDVEAVELREAEVEHDQIRMVDAGTRERLRSIGGAHDTEPGVLEVVAGETDDLRFVVDDEDRLHPADATDAAASNGRSGPRCRRAPACATPRNDRVRRTGFRRTSRDGRSAARRRARG